MTYGYTRTTRITRRCSHLSSNGTRPHCHNLWFALHAKDRAVPQEQSEPASVPRLWNVCVAPCCELPALRMSLGAGSMNAIAGSTRWPEGSMAISFVVLLAGYLLSVPLSLLIAYMVIATTLVLIGFVRHLPFKRRTGSSFGKSILMTSSSSWAILIRIW